MNDKDDIMQNAARLSQRIEPERDLWPDIEQSLTAPRRRNWTPMLAQAASVVLLVAASSAVTYFAVRDDGSASIAVQPEYVFEQAAFGADYNLGPGFTDARSGIVAKLDMQLERLSPEDRAGVEENLKMIRNAIDQINAELAEDPDNAHLQALLLKTYREELMMMRKVTDLTQNVMSRNDI